MANLGSFYTWRLGRQILVTFSISSFVITAILVIITKLQLDWLEDEMMTQTEKLLEDYTKERMYIQAK